MRAIYLLLTQSIVYILLVEWGGGGGTKGEVTMSCQKVESDETAVYIMFIIKYTSYDLGEATIYIFRYASI